MMDCPAVALAQGVIVAREADVASGRAKCGLDAAPWTGSKRVVCDGNRLKQEPAELGGELLEKAEGAHVLGPQTRRTQSR